MNKYNIIKLFEGGSSYRVIAKELNIDRKTVSKYCNEYKENLSMIISGVGNQNELQEKLIAAPEYNSENRKNYKFTSEVNDALEVILESEREKDRLLGKHKQALTKLQIFQQLKDSGFDIGKSTIYNKINEKREKSKECFIRQDYDFADRLEFDFGEVNLIISGHKEKLYMAVLSSPASNFRWAYLYKNQKKEVFMDAHVNFFEMVKGVYKEVVYDNMRNVVTKFLGKNEKLLNDDLIKMSLYYGFDINVTNAFSGNEKGHVEGSVKILRKEVFGVRFKFESFGNAVEYLEHRLIGLNENSLIQSEMKNLLTYKPKLELAQIREVTINKYSFARIENNSYSVPEYLVERKITAKVYYDTIRFFSNNHFVCEHKKIDGSGKTSIDIRHYLKTFEKKPGSIRNSLALKSMPELKSIYDIYFKSNPRKFIVLLKEFQNHEYSELIIKLKQHINLPSYEEQKKDILMITESQLQMYNNLTVKEVH